MIATARAGDWWVPKRWHADTPHPSGEGVLLLAAALGLIVVGVLLAPAARRTWRRLLRLRHR